MLVQNRKVSGSAIRLLFVLLYGRERYPHVVSTCPLPPEEEGILRLNLNLHGVRALLGTSKARTEAVLEKLESLGLAAVFMQTGPTVTIDVRLPQGISRVD